VYDAAYFNSQQQQSRSVFQSRVHDFILEGIGKDFVLSENEELRLTDFISNRNMTVNEHDDGYTIETDKLFFPLPAIVTMGQAANSITE